MKPYACVLFGALSIVAAAAQNEADFSGEPGFAPVVYQVPVIYQASVIYQAPVAYYAPVYYMANGYPPLAPAALYLPPPCPAPSTVLYIGGSGGTYLQAKCGTDCGSTVIHFGTQQACAYGYQFNAPR